MSMLIVLRAGERGGASAMLKAHRRIARTCEAMGMSAHCYIYGTAQDISELESALLEGKIYTQEIPFTSSASVAEEVSKLVVQEKYQGVIIANHSQANAIAVLLAQRCGFACVTDVCDIVKEKHRFVCKKLVYSNNLTATYALSQPFVFSERFAPAQEVRKPKNPVVFHPLPLRPPPSYLLDQQIVSTAQQREPSTVLFAAGMGIHAKEDLERIRSFAQENGFDFGVTRPVAMRGWADIDEIIGVSGTIYAPRVTVAFGISGAAAFFVGIEQSSYILSINTNAHATIAAQSDATIADDYKNVWESIFSSFEKYKIRGSSF